MTYNAFTPERIAQLRETLAKATPGPWHIIPPVEYDGDEDEFSGAYTSPAIIEGGDGDPVCAFGIAEGSGHLFENDADHQLIQLTRTTLPAALDEIEAQSAALTLANARIARLEEALKFYSDVGDYTAPQTSYVYGGENKLWCDCGGTARRALKEGA